VPRSKRAPRVLDAIHQALATFAALPDSTEARNLREQCLAVEATAREWATVPPSPEDRDALMRKVLALHVAITKLRRTMEPPE
jgi:hypothetical protein